MKVSGQPKEKHGEIAARLRRAIIQAHFRPGECLPTRVELCRQFDTTNVTLQKAFTRLKKDGFIVTSGRQGTRVAERPPHLSRFGLVFRGQPTPTEMPDLRQEWTFFQTACLHVVRQLGQQTADLEFVLYFGVDKLDAPDTIRLLDDLNHERLAGAIFLEPPWCLAGEPAVTSGTVPCLSFSTGDHTAPCPYIRRDQVPWIKSASDYLKRRGRVRPAVIWGVRGPDSERTPYQQRLMQCLKDAWPDLPDRLIFPVHVGAPEVSRSIVPTLLALPATERPDALLVGDDHLVEQVTVGLSRSPARLARSLDVVSLCNFPVLPRVEAPVKFLGFDVVAVIQTCIELLAARREGRKVEMVTPWEPVFDHQITVSQPGVTGSPVREVAQ